MNDLEFEYTGSALVEPLEALIERLESELAKIPAGDIEAAKSPGSLMSKTTPGEQKARALIGGLRDSRLWIHEALRAPSASWRLNLLALERLYPDDVLSAKIAELKGRA